MNPSAVEQLLELAGTPIIFPEPGMREWALAEGHARTEWRIERQDARDIVEVFDELVAAVNLVEPLARVALAALELESARAEWDRVSNLLVSALIEERDDITEPAPEAPIDEMAAFGTELYRPYRERLEKAQAEYRAALAAVSGEPE